MGKEHSSDSSRVSLSKSLEKQSLFANTHMVQFILPRGGEGGILFAYSIPFFGH